MTESGPIGWIGTGVMGHSMAGHLLATGRPLKIFTRSRSRCEALLARGAIWCDSAMAVAQGSDVVFSMVSNPEDVESVHLGPTGTLSASKLPRVLVDMTSSRPSLAERIATVAADKGVECLDAPVTGGDVGARNATLSIMVGGNEATFQRVLPLLGLMGKTIVLHGPHGSGQRAKLVNQVLIAANMVGVTEGIRMARQVGLDPSRVLESVCPGAAGSWTLSNLAPRILKGDFEPGFFIDHFVKDLRMALEEGEASGLDLPGLALAKVLYERAQAAGLGRKGTQGLALLYGADGSGRL